MARRSFGLAPLSHRTLLSEKMDDAALSLREAKKNLNRGKCSEALTHLMDAQRMIGTAVAHRASGYRYGGVPRRVLTADRMQNLQRASYIIARDVLQCAGGRQDVGTFGQRRRSS